MLNEDQESEMRSIKKKFTEENKFAVSSAEVSFNTRDGVRRPLSVHVLDTSNYTLTEVTNYVNT